MPRGWLNEITAAEGCDLIFYTLTKNLDEKGLSTFYGQLYEGTRDEEEEKRIAEAEGLAELAKKLKAGNKED